MSPEERDDEAETAVSASALVERALSAAAELGRSLIAAGRGFLSTALRAVQVAEEHIGALWERSGTCGEPADRLETTAGLGRSAHALDADLSPPPPADAVRRPEPVRTEIARATDAPDLPERYGRDRLSVAARDPTSLFAWWEVTEETRLRALREIEEQVGAEDWAVEPTCEALRLATLAEGDDRELSSSIVRLPPFARTWYVPVERASCRLRVTLGLLGRGRFVVLAAPIVVETPASEPSLDTSVRWRCGASESTEIPPLPAPDALERLYRHLGELPGSHDWPADRRVRERDLGGSSGLPIA